MHSFRSTREALPFKPHALLVELVNLRAREALALGR